MAAASFWVACDNPSEANEVELVWVHPELFWQWQRKSQLPMVSPVLRERWETEPSPSTSTVGAGVWFPIRKRVKHLKLEVEALPGPTSARDKHHFRHVGFDVPCRVMSGILEAVKFLVHPVHPDPVQVSAILIHSFVSKTKRNPYDTG